MDGQTSKQNSGSSQPDTNGNKTSGNNSSSKSSTSEERGRSTSTSGKQVKQVSENNLVKAPKVVSVEVPNAEKEKEKTEEAPKKNPRGAGRKKGTTVKKSTAAIKVMNKEDIKQLLIVTTNMFASKEGMEIWALTDKEADQLAEPLANILSRNEAFSKVAGANGDAMALVLAAFLIFVPKFMMWNATRPKKRKKGESINYGTGTEHINNGKSTEQQKGKVNAPSESPSRQPVKPTKQPDGKNINKPTGFGGSLGGLVPSLAGI